MGYVAMQICEEALRAIIDTSGPVKLVIGGPPCEDLALVNADRTGIKGKKSSLLHFIFVVLDLLSVVQPEQKVYFLVESTQMMALHNKEYIDRRFGAPVRNMHGHCQRDGIMSLVVA